nr:ImmA/IrrE family metallo-endopeptidase [uncultured Lachnoclostridium sp.]
MVIVINFWEQILEAYKFTGTFNPIILAEYLGLSIDYFEPDIMRNSSAFTCFKHNIIVLNTELPDSDTTFALVHEIAHNLNDRDSYHKNLSYICEKEANRSAVKLLVYFYFEIFSHETFNNIYILMKSMGIPSYLEKEVEKQIKSFYNSPFCYNNTGYSCGAVI